MDTHGNESHPDRQIGMASPQKLQLMLIEGAMRFANEAQRHWDEGRTEAAFESLSRCRRIVAELLDNVRPEMSAAARRATAVYLFLFQTLTDIRLHRQRKRIGEVLQILEAERHTWQLVCDAMPASPRWVERPPVEEVKSAGGAAIVSDFVPSDGAGCPAPPAGQIPA
jgi:flagellar protein FliS